MFKFSEEATLSISSYIEHIQKNMSLANPEINSKHLEMFLSDIEDDIKFLAILLSRERNTDVVQQQDVQKALRKLVIALSRSQKIFSEYHKQIFGDISFLKKRIKSAKIPQILDVGCGWGRVSRRLSKNFSKRAKIVGIDLNVLSLKYGKSLSPDTSFVRSHMKYLPFKEQTFDAVLSRKALHEIENENDRCETLDEIARALKKGGIIYVFDPFDRFHVAKLIRRLLRHIFSRVEWYYLMSEFENNLKRRGFKIIKKNYIDWSPFSLSVFCSYTAIKK